MGFNHIYSINVCVFNIIIKYILFFDAIFEKATSSIRINNDSKYLLAASTHKGEEEIVIDSYCKLLKDFQNLKIILVINLYKS